ncbi:hypothetical protein RhiirA4_453076 [Rhizophagus irregularis]|uniref:Uncharacterized protein n=1 Tax=Rhizophagus irregularis TaxID=588596 RepID=A0A2I1FZP4_9GLOM|nr:hypothetical protein RhiirA4_453076 [Rhizophagus irregularis]
MKTASTCFGCKKCPYCGIELKKTLVIDSSENDCDVDVFDETNNKEQITFKLEKAVGTGARLYDMQNYKNYWIRKRI